MIKRTKIILILIQNLIFSKEFPVHEIKLLGPITDPKQEISGMDWFQDKLLFLPENQGGFLFLATKTDIIDAIKSKKNQPITPKKTKFNTPDYSNLISGFDGFEAISFHKNKVFISIEAKHNEKMYGYIAWGKIDSKTFEIIIPEENLKKVTTPIQIDNMSFESMLWYNENIYLLYEANGSNLNNKTNQIKFSPLDSRITRIKSMNLEYRITDVTQIDSQNKFWCINYFWPGDKKLLNPNINLILYEGETHQSSETVERLVELEIKGDEIIISDSNPIQLVLDSSKSRNWEAIARLDNKGFLIATDKYPRMIFGYISIN